MAAWVGSAVLAGVVETVMARLKLELIPATPTWTPTITRIPTITNTPDPNRTSTPTTMPYGGPLYTPTQGIYP